MEIYFIRNTIDEYRTKISGYFQSFEEAMLAINECYDWYKSKPSGEIWKVKTGLEERPELVKRIN